MRNVVTLNNGVQIPKAELKTVDMFGELVEQRRGITDDGKIKAGRVH